MRKLSHIKEMKKIYFRKGLWITWWWPGLVVAHWSWST